MKGLSMLLAGALTLGAALPASGQGNAPDVQEPAPLLDRERFFGDPEISGAQLSPDGRFVSFVKPYQGVMNIWVKERDEPFDAARPITADDRPVPGYFWSKDARFVLYVQDKGGNENFHVYAVDPAAAPEAETGVPPARDLTPLDEVRAMIYAVPKATPDQIIVGLNDRDPAWHDVYRVDLSTGARTLVVENTEQVAGWQTDLAGNVRLGVRVAEDGSTEILRVDGASLTPVYACSVEESCSPVRFHRGGARVYMTTNKGADVDLTRLALLDPATGALDVVESDPEGEVDFGGTLFSERTDELVATYYVGDRLRYYPKDDAFARDLALLEEKLPEGEIYFGSATNDERWRLVSVTRDVDPGSTYLYDRETGEVTLLYRSRPELPGEQLAEMQAIRYTARDGLTIPAYLTLPKGVAPEKLPLVVMPHGGPWARDRWGYDAFAQFLANRGYAVLQPNFRSSTGYGKAFLNAGNEAWGEEMQDDLTDGVRYLIDRGIADPARVAIFGGSYGGYAALAGLTFTPEVYAAGISYVGPSNLITLLNSIPPYWAAARRMFNVRLGDTSDPEDAARLRRQSPLFAADRIRAPLLVIQGANDPRVKQAESDQIVLAARSNEVDVAYLVAPDEGHGFRGRENRLAVAAAVERFLAEHVGGRYQEEMTPEVHARLTALTVDPATVTLPDTTLAAYARTAPLPPLQGETVAPATATYNASVQVMGQSFAFDMTRTVAPASLDGEAVWRIVDRAVTPMGTSVDTVEAVQMTLRPLRRSATGQGTVMLRYTDETVTGALRGPGGEMPVYVVLDAPVLSDGPGFELALAGMRLAVGYETTVRFFDTMGQKVVPARLRVTGTETVQVPAGTFETYVVTVERLDGEQGGEATLHVRTASPHHVVKARYQLPPQMGSGVMTTELAALEEGGAD